MKKCTDLGESSPLHDCADKEGVWNREVRDLSDRFRVVSGLGLLRICSVLHCYQWFLISSDNMCVSGAGHKNDCFNQLLTCKVRLQPPALAPGTSVTDICQRVRGNNAPHGTICCLCPRQE